MLVPVQHHPPHFHPLRRRSERQPRVAELRHEERLRLASEARWIAVGCKELEGEVGGDNDLSTEWGKVSEHRGGGEEMTHGDVVLRSDERDSGLHETEEELLGVEIE